MSIDVAKEGRVLFNTFQKNKTFVGRKVLWIKMSEIKAATRELEKNVEKKKVKGNLKGFPPFVAMATEAMVDGGGKKKAN